MFTGLIQQLGIVHAFEPNEFGVVLRIDPQKWAHRPSHGDSIAVNGCCLTVTPDDDGMLRFDVIRQTLDATTLGGLNSGGGAGGGSGGGSGGGGRVNLEHAVTPATLMGGHIVQGHIDGVGQVIRVVKTESEWRVRVEPPSSLMEFIVEKGSITIDGVSLTLAIVGDDFFEVALIPTTLELTTMGSLHEGSQVNLETDCIAKTVVNWLKRREA
ncbi:MAG: riboflavin synthase [Planctomycetota bacterium]|nr:riboflavin synthase [Planctomycetota bacterium]